MMSFLVLEETEAIEGIVLKLSTPKEAHWNPESFSKMPHLKLLIIDNVYLLHDPKHLPNGLRVLDWGNYPSKYFPSSFQSKGLSLEDRYYDEEYDSSYHIVIPGSVIPKWFSHRSIGAEVNIKVENSSHLCDEWMGIAVCVVFSCLPHHHIDEDDELCNCDISCELMVNENEMNTTTGPRSMVGLSDHMWLFYFLPHFNVKMYIKLLKECEENEFIQIGIKIETSGPGMKVKKCGFRMVYKKDVEDLNQTVAQSSNTSHNFDNSMGVAEGKKAKQTHDDYDGAGPSGKGSSNEQLHPQRNERFIEFMAHGDSDCEEYLECSEELGDWQKSNESDLGG